jgi:hypothetical protein
MLSVRAFNVKQRALTIRYAPPKVQFTNGSFKYPQRALAGTIKSRNRQSFDIVCDVSFFRHVHNTIRLNCSGMRRRITLSAQPNRRKQKHRLHLNEWMLQTRLHRSGSSMARQTANKDSLHGSRIVNGTLIPVRLQEMIGDDCSKRVP